MFDAQGRRPYTGVSDGRILRCVGPELGWTTFAQTSTNRFGADSSEGRWGATAFSFWSQSMVSWKYPLDPTWIRRIRRRDAETLCSVNSPHVHIGQAVYGVELPSVSQVVHGGERPLGKTPQVPPLPPRVQGEVYRQANQTPGSQATSGLYPPWALSANLASIRLPLFPFRHGLGIPSNSTRPPLPPWSSPGMAAPSLVIKGASLTVISASPFHQFCCYLY